LLFSLFWLWWSHYMLSIMFPKIEEEDDTKEEEIGE